MAAQKGSNGIRDGEANEKTFLDWVKNTDDFKPFMWQGSVATMMVW